MRTNTKFFRPASKNKITELQDKIVPVLPYAMIYAQSCEARLYNIVYVIRMDIPLIVTSIVPKERTIFSDITAILHTF